MRGYLIIPLLTTLLAFAVGCGSDKNTHAGHEHAEHAHDAAGMMADSAHMHAAVDTLGMRVAIGDTVKAVYTCPMHPQILQDAPGRCPVCGMNLALKASAPADSATHDTSGHVHPMHDGHSHQ